MGWLLSAPAHLAVAELEGRGQDGPDVGPGWEQVVSNYHGNHCFFVVAFFN